MNLFILLRRYWMREFEFAIEVVEKFSLFSLFVLFFFLNMVVGRGFSCIALLSNYFWVISNEGRDFTRFSPWFSTDFNYPSSGRWKDELCEGKVFLFSCLISFWVCGLDSEFFLSRRRVVLKLFPWLELELGRIGFPLILYSKI